MQSLKVKITIITVVLLLAFFAKSLSKEITKPISQHKNTTIDNQTIINANDILMFVTNHGNFGRDLSGVIGIDNGTWYPYTGDMNDYYTLEPEAYYSPLYAAGLWVVGKVNGEIRVATSEYASEYVPGPMIDDTAQTDNPDFKVYKLYIDSLETNPNDDYLNWPVDQGAPVDGIGRPLMRGTQMLWSAYNDADTAKHVLYATDPLGIEVQQTTIAYTGRPQSIFIEYKLYNRSSHTIDSCFISLWADPDIGFASDDYIGCDTLDNFFYAYNSDNSDTQYGSSIPPAIGFKFLYGALVPSLGDSAYFDGYYIDDYKNLPLYSVNKYIGGVDPDTPEEVFNYAKGLDRFGSPILYSGNETKFVCSGDPVSGLGDLDTNPADRRIMGSVGPFTFAPGDSQFVMIQMAAAQGVNYLNSITQLNNVFDLPYNVPTGINDNVNNLPTGFILEQNYPNPFNPSTKINYSLPNKTSVRIEVYNILGQKVITLVDTEKAAGNHSVEWNSVNDRGQDVASGVYLYRLTTDEFVHSKKMVLIR